MNADESQSNGEGLGEKDLLENIYDRVLQIDNGDESLTALPEPYDSHVQTIIENQEARRAVLAVTITLLLKKLHDASQDIRQHQAQLEGGFSGRGLDTRVVTPFLRSNQFPHMQAGTGWLTRSLEQEQPYDLNYPGKYQSLQPEASLSQSR